MAKTVAQMTAEELKEIVGLAVEQKMVELFGDPDEGLVIRRICASDSFARKELLPVASVGSCFRTGTV